LKKKKKSFFLKEGKGKERENHKIEGEKEKVEKNLKR